MPRASAELQRYSAEYDLMQDIFGDFIEHTRSVVSPFDTAPGNYSLNILSDEGGAASGV